MIATSMTFRDFQRNMMLKGINADDSDTLRDARYLWWALTEYKSRQGHPEWLDVLDYGKHGSVFLHALLIARLAPCNMEHTKRVDQLAPVCNLANAFVNTVLPSTKPPDRPTLYQQAWRAVQDMGQEFAVSGISEPKIKSKYEPLSEGPHDVILIDLGKRAKDDLVCLVLANIFELCVTPTTAIFLRHGAARRKMNTLKGYCRNFEFVAVPETTIALGKIRQSWLNRTPR